MTILGKSELPSVRNGFVLQVDGQLFSNVVSYNKKKKLQNGDITKIEFRNKYKKCGCERERRIRTFKEIDGIKICKVCQNKDKKKKNS